MHAGQAAGEYLIIESGLDVCLWALRLHFVIACEQISELACMLDHGIRIHSLPILHCQGLEFFVCLGKITGIGMNPRDCQIHIISIQIFKSDGKVRYGPAWG